MVRGKLREDPFHGLLGYRDLVRSANIYFIIDFTASMPTQAGNFARVRTTYEESFSSLLFLPPAVKTWADVTIDFYLVG